MLLLGKARPEPPLFVGTACGPVVDVVKEDAVVNEGALLAVVVEGPVNAAVEEVVEEAALGWCAVYVDVGGTYCYWCVVGCLGCGCHGCHVGVAAADE